jgi:hypothetical protein
MGKTHFPFLLKIFPTFFWAENTNPSPWKFGKKGKKINP